MRSMITTLLTVLIGLALVQAMAEYAKRAYHTTDAWRDKVEAEHVVMCAGYLLVAVMGSESPGVMAFTYGTVGVAHTMHLVRQAASKKD